MEINHKALYQYIGTAIRRNREARGMTQAQLAEAVGMLRTSVVNLEAGRQRAPLHTLYPVCAVLGIEATALLPSVHTVLAESQLVLPIDGIDTVVPARTAAYVNELLGDKQEGENT